ncbi:hypothetical protein Ae201684P_009166 [Aphanomyces euteiches]|nr:hypothetical protein Ae201684P_009166 [Aphanomyces euteiches]
MLPKKFFVVGMSLSLSTAQSLVNQLALQMHRLMSQALQLLRSFTEVSVLPLVIYVDVDLESTVEAMMPLGIIQVLAGCETGVALADVLSDRMGLTSNGASKAVARRNKFAMGEAIRAAGLRAVKQLRFTANAVILKPSESAGGDAVYLCTCWNDVQEAFDQIQGSTNQLGITNSAVLVQEYLVGTEYVVDTVSQHGVHKVVAIWEYEKGPANNAPFVYFVVRLMDPSESPRVSAIVNYILQVLDALHIAHGPAHAEVKWVVNEPCLVETGARCHGNNGTFIPTVDQCIGYNQVTATLDSYIDEQAFNALPAMPPKLRVHGCEVSLVSYARGFIESCPGYDVVESLASYHRRYMLTHVGHMLVPTVDVFTKPGSIWLLHESKDVIEDDIKTIRELERDGFWKIKED